MQTSNNAGEVIEKDYYIVSGVYISPWAQSLVCDNEDLVNGYLLDTTWKIMSRYVTSILMTSTYNVGVPIGFAFGRGEDKAIYNELFSTISEQTSIVFPGKVIESDQGTALKAAIGDLSMMHLACFRHLLVNLKFNPYSYLIDKIVRCTTEFELQNVKNHVIDCIKKRKDEKDLNNMQHALKKIGLQYNKNTETIDILDETRWIAVSMMHRLNFKMPSTTNSLESTHGHLNKKTPRNNNFYMSIYRIVTHLMKQSQTIEENIRRNYMYAKNKTLHLCRDRNRLMPQIAFYGSTIQSCRCNENKLVSSMLRIDMPCCHRHILGAPFPACPVVRPRIELQWDQLVISYNVLPPENDITPHDVHFSEKKYIVDQIKKYSKFKDISQIEEYVNMNYTLDQSQYIDARPLSAIQLITEGVFIYANMQKQAKSSV